MTGFQADMPACQNCGGPLTAAAGQTIAFSTTLTEGAGGGIEGVEAHSGWCGACIEDWNRRMGADDG